MRSFIRLTTLIALFFASAAIMRATAQDNQTLHAANGMNARPNNYTWFTPAYKDVSDEVIKGNPGYEKHPEIGMLFAETPCDGCYEVLKERTEISKTFIKKNTGGRDIMRQTSNMPMHFRDEAGNWKTIRTRIEPDNAHAGVFAAYDQPVPVVVNTAEQFVTLGKSGEQMKYNNALELVYSKPDGTEVSLGTANWSDRTAGDDGVYVNNAWPGIDIEMHTIRGAIKTNYIINRALPAYADGKLLVRDHLQMDNGLSLSVTNTSITGNIEVLKNGALLYAMSAANAYEKNAPRNTVQFLEYGVHGNVLDIALPGAFLNRTASAYPVVIDPLVSTPTSVAVTGASYSVAATVGCAYLNPATVPANCTITDIQWTFNYVTSGGAWMEYGYVDFREGTCRSPGTAGFYWSCALPSAGTCTGTAISIFADAASNSYLSSCVSAPQCTPYDLNITMKFYQNWATTPACATTYYSGATPYMITVFGHTVEANAVIVTGGGSTICAGQSASLSVSGTMGVPPYTYTWMPGSLSGNPVSVSPATTTTYTATITDACGITATATQTITVLAVSPITGTPTACVGGTSTLADATAGGTWSSANSGIASVDASGVVTGNAGGTTVITYTAPSGCTVTQVFTVNPPPATISGPSQVCQGSTITLSDASGTGSWASNFPGTASVGATTGIVTGMVPGTATITFTLPTSCSITTNVTVNPTYTTSFTASICQGSSYVFAGNTYTSSGTYPNPFTAVTGCDSTATLILTVVPFSYHSFNDSTCTGAPYAYAGHVYTATGTYVDTFTSAGGCDSIVTLNLYVKPLPAAPLTSDLIYCQNDIAAHLTASGFNLTWYTVPFGGVPSSASPVPSTATPGIFTFYVSQIVDGCEGPRAPLQVTVHEHPVFTIGEAKPYDCQYDTLTLYYAGPSFPGAQYSWTIPSYAHLTADTTTDPQIVVAFDTSYTHNIVTLTVGDGYAPCNVTDSISAPVFITSPLAGFYAKEDVCAGDSVKIALSEATVGVTDYIWNFDGGTVVVASSNHGGPYQVVWNTAGIYTVSLEALSSPYCPSKPVYDTIKVHARPMGAIAGFTVLDGKSTVCIGDSVLFKPYAYDVLNSYTWTPAHFFNQNNADSVYGKVEVAGYVTLTTVNPFGCTSYDSILINAQPCCTVAFPSAFSPNGDGHNDVFRPITPGNHRVHNFRIANRWGQTVFETVSEHGDEWDGTYNGVPQDAGVYYYFFVYDCSSGTMTLTGDVTLVR